MEFFNSPYDTQQLDNSVGSFLESYLELKVVCDAGATVVVNRYENNVIVDTINVGVVSSGECIVNLPCFGEWASSATLNGVTISDYPHLIVNEVRKYESDVGSVSSKLHFTQNQNLNVLSPAYQQNEFLVNTQNYSFTRNTIVARQCTQQETTEANTNDLPENYLADIGYDEILDSNIKIKNTVYGALFSCTDSTKYTNFKNLLTSKTTNSRRPYVVPVSNYLFILIYFDATGSTSWVVAMYNINDLSSEIYHVALNSTSASYANVNNLIQISKVQNSSSNFLIIWKRSLSSNEVIYYDVLEILLNELSLKNSQPLSISMPSGSVPCSFPLQYEESFILFTTTNHIFKLDMLNDFSFSVIDKGEISNSSGHPFSYNYNFVKMSDGRVVVSSPYSNINNLIYIYVLEINSNFTCSLINTYTSYTLAETSYSTSGTWENTEPFDGSGPYPIDWPISSEWNISAVLSKINYDTIIFLYTSYQHDYGYYAPTSSGGNFYNNYYYYINGYIFKYKNGQLFY
ncbi:MAG: hypothetical protein IKL08_00485 [Clostridia bacterium]|nr:hypothetical protein [Clostridia bacterium]